MNSKNAFIEFMIGAGVLTFGDFTTKSGRKTPYFINTGNYKTGAQISVLGDWYADCIVKSGEPFDALFGPAYKGIPLAAAAASSLWRNHGRDVPYCFNRKEIKDHGEGGALVGYRPKDGDTLAIIEDVVTAGTAVRESITILSGVARVRIGALFVSVDRMERGTGSLSALDELRETLGIRVYPDHYRQGHHRIAAGRGRQEAPDGGLSGRIRGGTGGGMNIHDGHRERMKKRFQEHGLENFDDHSVLELLLFYVLPRADVNPIAHALMNKFGALAAVFDAPVDELVKVPGIGMNTAVCIKLIPQISRRYLVSRSSFDDILDASKKGRRLSAAAFFRRAGPKS